ncbi:MAG: hypothetical protein ACRCWQ_01330 [Bacilli bacterium]
MKNNFSILLLGTIVLFAILGFATNIQYTLQSILIFGIIVGGFLLIMRYRGGTSASSASRKYQQAVKQSKAKYQTHQKTSTSTRPTKKTTTHRRDTHGLVVIEGKKSK